MLQLSSQMISDCSLDRFTKTFFWNFQSIPADLCYILIYKQMLEKAFCSNITPSLSSGNHLFYKAEYMGRSCPYQVWAITFDWIALATWNKHSWTAFWKFFSGTSNLPGFCDVPGAGTWHLNSQVQGALCQVICARWHKRWASGVSLKRGSQKCSSGMFFLGR